MKYRISKKDIVTIAICFAFIPVTAVELLIGNLGYLALMLFTGGVVLLLSIFDNQILKSRQFLIWTVLLLWMTVCTIVNNQSILFPIYYVGQVALWYLINDWFIGKGSLRLLRMSRKYVGAVIVITFLQQMLAPGIFGYTASMNARTFFTSDNFLGYYYVAYIAVCFVLDFVDYKKTQPKTYLMVGICLASIIRAWSVKSVIGIACIVLYILFAYRKKISRLLTPKVLFITFILIFVGIVFFNVQDNFIGFFSRYFGKSATVSVRYYIWVQAIENIKENPIFGFGIREGQRLLLQSTMAGNARSSHNIVLELILEGGLIGFGIYLCGVIAAFANRKESILGRNKYEYLLLSFIVFAFFVMELASGSIYYPFYYMPIILVNNLDKIVAIKERAVLYAK